MKKIGMLGGMSFESTTQYYDLINRAIQKTVGGSASAEILMYSFNFAELEVLQSAGKWDELTQKMVHWANALKSAGADFIVICANTMHRMAPAIEAETGLPVLHIAAVTGEAIVKQSLKKVVLLGTKYVMEGDFYVDILQNNYDLQVMIPNNDERQVIHDIIYNELIQGVISQDSKAAYLKIIERLRQNGAQGIVLGCTEIPLLISQADVSIPVFSTTEIHAKAAASFALATE